MEKTTYASGLAGQLGAQSDNEDTVNLLQEVNSGCKSATNSMEQVRDIIKDESLKRLIENYNDKHIALGDESHRVLKSMGEPEKEPPAAAKAFSWLSTEVKLMLKDEDSEVATLMTDGCNMGIKSISKQMNQYKNADETAKKMAKQLVATEEEFMDKLLGYL